MAEEVAYVNLDLGCFSTPYTPVYDVREKFTLEKLMLKERLGPNSAVIRLLSSSKGLWTTSSRQLREAMLK